MTDELVYLSPRAWLAKIFIQKVVEPNVGDRPSLNVCNGGECKHSSRNRFLGYLLGVLVATVQAVLPVFYGNANQPTSKKRLIDLFAGGFHCFVERSFFHG